MIEQTNMSTLLDAQSAAPIVLWTLSVLGLILCMTGRKLARPLFALAGMSLGAAIAFILPKGTTDPTMSLVWIIAGGVVGVVLGFLLFRIWMGIGLALVLALAIPAVGLALHGQLPSLESVTDENLMMPFGRQTTAPRDNDDTDAPSGAAGEMLPVDEIIESMRRFVDSQDEAIGDWWDDLGAGGQYTVTFCAGAGALIGLFIGLIGPYFAASVIAALIGSSLVLSSLQQLNLPYLDSRLPSTPRAVLMTIGLITAACVIVQWTVFRRKADK
jgi:hypothetical protein